MSVLSPGVRFTPPPLADRLARGLVTAQRGAPARILDPACGDGELLLAAWRTSGRRAALARDGLFGIELDPLLAERARTRLAREIGGEAGRRAAAHVLTGNALDPELAWPAGTRVLANPPWVSLSGRQRVALPARERARILRDWPATRGWPSLHGAFLERIARHVQAQGSRAACLLPASVAQLEGYAELRRTVTAHATLAGTPEELGEDTFPGVCEPALLLALRGRRRVTDGDDASWWRPWTAAERSFHEHLRAFPSLPPACFGDPGVHTGNARAELIVPDPPAGLARVREGRDLAPYRLGPARLGLRTDLRPSAARRFRIAAPERYRDVTVLVRQTADRPLAALHTDPTYFRNSLLACRPPDGLDPAFAVAVLNAEVATRWHRLCFADGRQRSFPQVKVRHLRSLPFPLIDRARDPALHDAIADEARALAREPRPAPERHAALSLRVARAFGLRGEPVL